MILTSLIKSRGIRGPPPLKTRNMIMNNRTSNISTDNNNNISEGRRVYGRRIYLYIHTSRSRVVGGGGGGVRSIVVPCCYCPAEVSFNDYYSYRSRTFCVVKQKGTGTGPGGGDFGQTLAVDLPAADPFGFCICSCRQLLKRLGPSHTNWGTSTASRAYINGSQSIRVRNSLGPDRDEYSSR